MLVVPATKQITDSFYRLHFNFVQNRATRRSAIRKEIRARGTSPTLDEVDRLMWSTRHHEYKFTEVTRSNIQEYIDVLNLYFSFPYLEFQSLIMDRLDPDASLGRWNNDEWEAYTHFAKELMEKSLTRDVFAIVDLQGDPKKSNVHLEDVLCSIPSVKGCLRATSDMSIYLQLVDVLLGCVQFDFKDHAGFYETISRRAQAKRDLANLLKSKLGMGREDAFLQAGQSFNRWDAPSTFTVWREEW